MYIPYMHMHICMVCTYVWCGAHSPLCMELLQYGQCLHRDAGHHFLRHDLPRRVPHVPEAGPQHVHDLAGRGGAEAGQRAHTGGARPGEWRVQRAPPHGMRPPPPHTHTPLMFPGVTQAMPRSGNQASDGPGPPWQVVHAYHDVVVALSPLKVDFGDAVHSAKRAADVRQPRQPGSQSGHGQIKRDAAERKSSASPAEARARSQSTGSTPLKLSRNSLVDRPLIWRAIVAALASSVLKL